MKRYITVSCAALALSVALASVPSFAQSASSGDNAPIAKNVKKHKKTHKLAQGPAGLNGGNAAGPGYAPWAGPANNYNNPISGSPQDPGMHKPLGTPSR